MVRFFLVDAIAMLKIRDDPAARLDRLINSLSTRPFMEELAKFLGASEPLRFGPDWEEDAIRTAAALRAVDPNLDTSLEAPIRIAFQKFGLDPRNPENWRTLLAYFAFAHFGPKTTKRGRKRGWDSERLCQLLQDIADKRQKHPSQSDNRIYKFLLTDRSLKRRYQGETVRSLKHRHQLAKSPKYNEVLAILRDEFTQLLFSKVKRLLKGNQGVLSDADIWRVMEEEALTSAVEVIERGISHEPIA